jgi:predicted nucleic acid-binding protein
MSDDFIDSNVLLYLFAEDDAARRERATSLLDDALGRSSGVISYQVVQEVLNAIIRRAGRVTVEDARVFLHDILRRLWRVMPSETLYDRALSVRERYRYGFYDSLIIASALEAGCSRLLSEDLHDGQRIEGVTIENPFRGLAAAGAERPV